MRTIMIVDDQPEVRELVELTLRSQQFNIIQASSGSTAIEEARAELPDLILMDVMMPGDIDGYEAVRTLKNDPATKDIVIFMLTAKGQKSDYEQGMVVGADGYFTKPFSPLELIKKVEEIIAFSNI